MRFTIISKNDEKSKKTRSYITNELEKRGMKEDKIKPEIIISIGGDGTLLGAFHMYQHLLAETMFVGVHTGNLGFYADFHPEESDLLIDLIDRREFVKTEFPLVHVKVHTDDGEENHLALNETTLKMVRGSTLAIDVGIGGKPFEKFRGDGICISTPSGSTAYNKSLGGALIHPSFQSIQLTEIASINNRVFRTIGSSIILPSHHTLNVYPNKNDTHLLTIDHLHFQLNGISSIEYKVAEETIKFARFRHFPFWHRVRESFISS